MNIFAQNKIWQNWLLRRFALPVNQSKTLRQRDVLVFFNREGYLYGVLLIITFIAGINYANNLILGFCFLLTGILILSFYLAFWQMYGLTVAVHVNPIGQVGRALPLKLDCTPKSTQIHLHLRVEFEQINKKINILQSPLTLEFESMPTQRGLMRLSRIRLISVYPLGIIRAWSLIYPVLEIWVAPQPLEVDITRYGFGALTSQSLQGIDDFSHLREFQSSDAQHRIAWQHYAKGRGLLVKQFEYTQRDQLIFDYKQMPASSHEDKLSQLMYLIEQAQAQNLGFGLSLPTQSLPYQQGQHHFRAAQLCLAREP